MPVFSIVIPLYNKERHIAETLNSVLLQTFDDYEVIVIDDGSTDGSAAEVKKLSDNRIIYIKTGNKGVSSARNTGIDMAKGEIIAFLDADDIWMPTHLQELYNLYKDYPEAGILHSGYIIKAGNTELIPHFEGLPEQYRGMIDDPFKASLHYRLGIVQVMGVRKNVFETAGYFDPQLSNMEDTDFWIRAALAFPFAVTGTTTVVYNYGLPGSLSGKEVTERNMFNFIKFEHNEKENKSLKAFLDVYRLDYALKFRIKGRIAEAKALYMQASPENIPLKSKVLFILSPFVLKKLLQLKQWLLRRGYNFSVYS